MVKVTVISDPKLFAETYAYFIIIVPELAAESNELNGEPQIDSSAGFHTQLNFSQINVSSVTLTLKNLKANKATHVLDKIAAKIHKKSSDIIAQSLTHIFNLFLATGIYIDEWKHARVSPNFKSDDRRKCENYRPISILPIISKVFETELFDESTVI